MTSTVQRRTLTLLFSTQILGGVGTSLGITVGALLAARLGGTGISGLAASSAVVGSALLAVPVTRLMRTRGRRPGLVVGYLAGAVGAALVVAAAAARNLPLLFLGMALFGGGTTANLQARYAAVDLSEPANRGRHLSLIVWATTLGAVAAPNLTPLADRAVRGFGVPRLAGPFAISVGVFVVAAAVLFALLRPDPLLTARAASDDAADDGAGGDAPGRRHLVEAWRAVAAEPAARLGIASVAVGHLVMVGVMSMTPVHIGQSHHDADVLRIVGIVISLHIAGMYALAPVVGLLTDRFGRRPVILGGVAVLLTACAIAGTAGAGTGWLAVGLTLLGLGWSGTMVAGSTLLTESVSGAVRPTVQGLADLIMGLAAASAGALSGVVVDLFGYATLNLLAALATLPLVALALRNRQAGPAPVVRPVPAAVGTEGD